MRIYSVMINDTAMADAGEEPARRVRAARLVRDGFSWPAFFLGPLWLLWHRLWRPLVIVMAVLLAMGAAPPLVQSLASLAVSLILGFEGNGLLRAGLERRGWREAAVIVAAGRDEAELRLAALLTGDEGGMVNGRSTPPPAAPDASAAAAQAGA